MNQTLSTKAWPAATRRESLRFAASVLGNYLQGLFVRRPMWVRLFARLRSDPIRETPFTRLRRKYRAAGSMLRLGRKPKVLLLDAAAVDEMLAASPEPYGAPSGKRKGMGHFQPHALAISRGLEWRERRAFNERVLQTHATIHSCAEVILRIVDRETTALKGRDPLRWPDLAVLFERIALQVIFGRADDGQREIAARLRKLMREANRGFFLRRGEAFEQFRQSLTCAIGGSTPDSLAGRATAVNPEARVSVPDQITHWLFAMGDTLAENAARALGVIAGLDDVQTRVRAELAASALDTPGRIESLAYLGGCIQEAMRLWPTTPLLTRAAAVDTILAGHRVASGTQLFVSSTEMQRDPDLVPDAATFLPEHWAGRQEEWPRSYHFGGGAQRCPGSHLALFIAKAALALLLRDARYQLRAPQLQSARRMPQSFNPYALVVRRQ